MKRALVKGHAVFSRKTGRLHLDELTFKNTAHKFSECLLYL